MSRKKDFNFDDMLGMGTGGPTNAAKLTDYDEDTGIQESNVLEVGGNPQNGDLQKMTADLLAAHVGLKTSSAKKTTFDFTPEFARALKRWSVDANIPMRDLVVKAVVQVIPPEYLQEYRNTGIRR